VKDDLLAQLFKNMVEIRLAQEINKSELVYVTPRVLSNPDCISALKNVLCWYNFPKCDDRNRSLPLCRTSCEQYYRNCGYAPNAGDNLFDECRQETVAEKGLFEGMVPGSDQVLADNNAVCESTEALIDALEEADANAKPIWMFSTEGKAILGTSFVLLLITAYFYLVPHGFRLYISWATRQVVMYPVERWRKFPILKGSTLMIVLTLSTMGLVGYGVYRRMTDGDLDRFENANAPPSTTTLAPTSTTTTTTTTTDYLSAWFGNEDVTEKTNVSHPAITTEHAVAGVASPPSLDVQGAYEPPAAVWEFDANSPLTVMQQRQLIGSCSCTGSAPRATGLPDPRLCTLVMMIGWNLAAI